MTLSRIYRHSNYELVTQAIRQREEHVGEVLRELEEMVLKSWDSHTIWNPNSKNPLCGSIEFSRDHEKSVGKIKIHMGGMIEFSYGNNSKKADCLDLEVDQTMQAIYSMATALVMGPAAVEVTTYRNMGAPTPPDQNVKEVHLVLREYLKELFARNGNIGRVVEPSNDVDGVSFFVITGDEDNVEKPISVAVDKSGIVSMDVDGEADSIAVAGMNAEGAAAAIVLAVARIEHENMPHTIQYVLGGSDVYRGRRPNAEPTAP